MAFLGFLRAAVAAAVRGARAAVFADSRGGCWAAFLAHPEPSPPAEREPRAPRHPRARAPQPGPLRAEPPRAPQAVPEGWAGRLPSCARGEKRRRGGSARASRPLLISRSRVGEGDLVLTSPAAPRLLPCRARAKPLRGQRSGEQLTPGKWPLVRGVREGNSLSPGNWNCSALWGLGLQPLTVTDPR